MHQNILFYWVVNFKTPLPTLVYYMCFISSNTNTVKIKDINLPTALDSPTFCLMYNGIILEHKFDKDVYNIYKKPKYINNSYIRLSPSATHEIIMNTKNHVS